jgi:hypothetical protein
LIVRGQLPRTSHTDIFVEKHYPVATSECKGMSIKGDVCTWASGDRHGYKRRTREG